MRCGFGGNGKARRRKEVSCRKVGAGNGKQKLARKLLIEVEPAVPGGVDTAELSARTMESRKVAGLYFIGEVVDVTGHLGGFNFQWAWASGAAAGRALGGEK